MQIVKYSETIYFSEAAILSSQSRRRYFNDILAHLRNLDEPTWFLLFATSMLVAFVLFLVLKIPFCKAFWMVLKAFLYQRKYFNFIKISFQVINDSKKFNLIFSKASQSYLPSNIPSLLLIVYYYCIIFLWLSINKLIGAYLVTNMPENAIDSIKDLVDHKDVIPTVSMGSAFESLFEASFKSK
jgi:hypothetical protein